MTVPFVRVASVAELVDAGGLLGRVVEGLPVALFAVDGSYFATLDRCTHGAVRLSEGYLEGTLIECPLHQGVFDVRTGAVAGPPCTRALETFEVKEEGGELFVAVRKPAEAPPA
ncbi:MAG: non-heme iron oxygenase ferredoxin subunit [Rhizobiaceae bacterium]|nr:non-heme iron oxygenase ferredoxin subunit [Rhizobiaceae bacterium]